MKKQFFYSMLMASAVLAGCSSEKVAEEGVGGGNNSYHGDGYIAVSVNLPTDLSNSSRAANDNYDDGLASEYAIKTASLILFEGTDEANATYKQTVDLYPSLQNELDADNDNITSSHLAVAKVNAIGSGNKLFGLVLLNHNGVFNGAQQFTTSSSTYDLTSATKFSDVQGLLAGDLATLAADAAKGFFMTNAVLSTDKATNTTAPSASNIKLLVDLSDHTYPTEAEARSNPSGSIYVERGVAKATLGVKSGVTQIACTTPLTIDQVTWAINNTEPTSYIVRKPHTASIAYSSEAYGTAYYRFLGNASMGTTTIQPAEALYRTYWCEDPEYNAVASNLVHNSSTFKAIGTGNPQYCNENTFDVANQTYQNTTRAVIKVTTTPATTFYTDNGVNEQCTKATINSRIMQVVLNDLTFVNAIQSIYTGGGTLALTADMFTVNWTAKDANGAITVDNIAVNALAGGWNSFSGFANQAAVETAVNSNQATAKSSANYLHKVLEYTDGVVYYEQRFMHFADPSSAHYTGSGSWDNTDTDLAPWNKWESTTKPTSSVAYPANTKTAEENYLGRWGMVRNNWYDVTITAFNKIGLPVDPSTTISNPTTPDDHIDDNQYISVKINVLSWAKRTQGWTF